MENDRKICIFAQFSHNQRFDLTFLGIVHLTDFPVIFYP